MDQAANNPLAPRAAHHAQPLAARPRSDSAPATVEAHVPLIASIASRRLSAPPTPQPRPITPEHSLSRASTADDLRAVAANPPAPPAPSRADSLKGTIIQEKTYIGQRAEQHQQQLTRLKTMKVWNKVLIGIGIVAAITATALAIVIFPPLGIIGFGGGVLFTLGMAKIGDKLVSQKPDMTKGEIGRAENRLETLNKALELFETFPMDKSHPNGNSFEEFLEKNAKHTTDEQTGLETYEYNDLETCVTIFWNKARSIPEKQLEIQKLKEKISELEQDRAAHIVLEEVKKILLKQEIALGRMNAEVHDAMLLREGEYPGKPFIDTLAKYSWGESSHIDSIPPMEFPLNSNAKAICFFGNEARIPDSYVKGGNIPKDNAAILTNRGYDSAYDFLSINAPGLRPIVIDGKGYRTVAHYLLQRKLDKINEGRTPKDEGYINPAALKEVSDEISKAKTGQEAIEAYTSMMPGFPVDEIFKGLDDDLKKALFHKYINPDGTITADGWALLSTGDALLIAGHEAGDKSYGAKMSMTAGRAENAVLKGKNKLGRYTMDFRDFLHKYREESEKLVQSAFLEDMNHQRNEAATAAGKAEADCKTAKETRDSVEKTISTARKWVTAMVKNNDKETGIAWNQRFRTMVDGAEKELKKLGEKHAQATKQLDECDKIIQKMRTSYDAINKTPQGFGTKRILDSALKARDQAQRTANELNDAITKLFDETKRLEEAASNSEERFADHSKVYKDSLGTFRIAFKEFSEHCAKAKGIEPEIRGLMKDHATLMRKAKASFMAGNKDEARRLAGKAELFKSNINKRRAEMIKERKAAEAKFKELGETAAKADRMAGYLERSSLPFSKDELMSLKRNVADAKANLDALDKMIAGIKP